MINPVPRTDRPAWLAVLFLIGWTGVVVWSVHTAALAAAWFTDLSKLPFSAQNALLLSLLHPALVLPPALLMLRMRTARPAAAARVLLLATLAAALLLLPRLFLPPPAVIAAGLWRSATATLFGIILLAWAGRRGRVQMRPGWGLTLFLLLAPLFLLPWLLYGALGDGLDTLSAFVQALSLALLAAGLAANLMPALAEPGVSRRNTYWLGGLTLATALLSLAAAWGQMGYQALLMLALPALGFLLALVAGNERRYDVISVVIGLTLILFGPLAFADPTEVRLISLFSNDTAVWTLTAAALNLLSGLILLGLLAPAASRELAQRLRWLWGVLAGLGWAGAIAVWLLAGQPGFYGDDFFVVFTAQADLSPAAAIADVDERRAWVYANLTAQADATQADLVEWLDERGIPYTRYYLVNGIEVQGNVLRRWQIARRPEVDRVLLSPRLRPLPRPTPLEPGLSERPQDAPWGIEAIGAPRVWAEFGVTGEGVVVGQSDSGVDAAHPLLAPTYRGAGGDHDFNWFDPWTNSPAPQDGSGHGTHTLGTVLGQEGVGVAPGAVWFACANLVRNLGNPANYLDCMQFMLAPHPQGGDPLGDGRPDLAADVSTNSWGCPVAFEGCDQQTLWQAAAALRAAGIFFVVAAGNDGPACDSLRTPPGNYGNVLSVGALAVGGDLATFSNRGPNTGAPDAAAGPDLLAPGVGVLSAWPGGGWAIQSGTSMAAPHVAGVVALMWSANPKLRGDIDTTERILQQTAAPYTGQADGCGVEGEFPDSGAGYGVLDAYAAVTKALSLR